MTRRSDSVTIRDVAKHAAVSVATVSRFINQTAPVSQEVSERIQQVMLDLNYKPHAVARLLATRKTRTIGLIVHHMHSDFFVPLLSGIEPVVIENQYNLLVATYKSSTYKDNQPPVGTHNTDGILVFADSLSEEQLVQLCQTKFPLVLIHRSSPGNLKIPFVTVENKITTQKMIDHLIEVHGRRSILFLRGPLTQEDTRWREQGYRDSLEAHHIPFDQNLVIDGEFNSEIAYKNTKNLIEQKKFHFDAIFSGSDDAAVGALKALHETGLRIPEDVSIVGFDDQRISFYLNPPLTTVHAPTAEVGRCAATLLFNLIKGQPAQSATLLPTEIIIRRSCGCMPTVNVN